jgi:hypothetical protein
VYAGRPYYSTERSSWLRNEAELADPDSGYPWRFGAIAQLGERLDRTQEVAGSSPASSTLETVPYAAFFPAACLALALLPRASGGSYRRTPLRRPAPPLRRASHWPRFEGFVANRCRSAPQYTFPRSGFPALRRSGRRTRSDVGIVEADASTRSLRASPLQSVGIFRASRPRLASVKSRLSFEPFPLTLEA